jgi:LmbE family N-acetylglucosaminyl deacetylase
MKLFLSPHDDDQVLFGSFTLMRERPQVVICLDSYIQAARGNTGCDLYARARESEWAQAALGVMEPPTQRLGLRDDSPIDVLREQLRYKLAPMVGQVDMVFAPAVEDGGHVHHNMIGELAAKLFPNVTHYMTYTTAGKSAGVPVPYEPEWLALKLKALACYQSQITLASTAEHFIREQREYYLP